MPLKFIKLTFMSGGYKCINRLLAAHICYVFYMETSKLRHLNSWHTLKSGLSPMISILIGLE